MNSPKAYLGKDKYIFVSYAHADKDKVYPVIAKLQEKYNVWFDEGIKWGKEWDVEIVQKLSNCSLFLYLVSERSLKSNNCKDEISYAKDSGLPFINICIEQVELPEEFKFRYGRYQMCFLYNFNNLDDFLSDFTSRAGKIVNLEEEKVVEEDKPTPKQSRVLDIELDLFHAAYTELICELNNKPCPEISKTTLLKKKIDNKSMSTKGYFPFLTLNLKNVSDKEVKINTAIFAVGSFEVGKHIDKELLLNEYSSRKNYPLQPGLDFDGYLAGPFLISFIEAILKDNVKSIVVEINEEDHYYPITEFGNVVDIIKDNFTLDMIDKLKGEDILYRFVYTLKEGLGFDFFKDASKEEKDSILLDFWAGSQKSITNVDIMSAFGYGFNRTFKVKQHLIDCGILSPICGDEKTGLRKVIRSNFVNDLYPTITFGYPPS